MRWVVVVCVAGVLAGTGAAWWVLTARGEAPVPGSHLRVLFSGETQGELEPCNCSGKMAGGLPARGGYLKLITGDRLLVDTGCVGNGVRDFEVLRMQATLYAMREMGYDAVNIGEHELWLGKERLQPLMGLGVPFVSANVTDDAGRPAAAPYLSLRRSGIRLAVTGVVESDRYQVGPGLKVTPPREVLSRLVPELRRKGFHVIIVLADLEYPAIQDLAHDFPEITAILFRGRGDSHAPERVNRSVVASIYGEARYLGDMTLTWETAQPVSATGEAVLLDERFPHSDAVREVGIDWYKSAVQGRVFDLSQPGPGWDRIQPQEPETGNAYVGSEACRKCHPEQYRRWSGFRHSHAMESLQKIGYDRSPECVVCHTVGYGSTGGYVSMEKTPELGRVGCEDCHGPGKILLAGHCKGLARPGAEETCRRCHTMKRHPDFNYKAQWEKIKHKETKQP